MLGVVRRNPEFRRLWLAQVVSQAGDWLNHMAVLALIGQLSGRAAQVGMGVLFAGELALRMLPVAFFGPIAGPIADRLPRRLLMVAADLARAVVVLGYLVVDTEAELPLLYGLLLTQMSLSIFFESARSASVPSTLPAEELHEAYTLSAATWSTMLAVGAFLGGVLLRTLGLASVFLIDAVTYVASALLLARLSLPPAPTHEKPLSLRDLALFVDLRRGLAHVRELGLVPVLLVKTFWGMAGGFLVLLAVLGRVRFGSGSVGSGRGGSLDAEELAAAGFATSLLYAARGVGTGLGPVLARRLLGSSDRALRLAIVIGFLVAGVFYGLVPWAPGIGSACVLIALAHMGGSTIWVSSTTYWQRKVGDAFRGRVYSLDFLGVTLSFTAWAFVVGVLYDLTGSLDAGLWVGAAGALVSGLAWALYSRRLG